MKDIFRTAQTTESASIMSTIRPVLRGKIFDVACDIYTEHIYLLLDQLRYLMFYHVVHVVTTSL